MKKGTAKAPPPNLNLLKEANHPICYGGELLRRP
jgi:hypothetical protein